jgi:hypothetical protein
MTWTLREAHPIDGGAGTQVLWKLVVLEGDRVARNEVVFDRTRLARDAAATPTGA